MATAHGSEPDRATPPAQVDFYVVEGDAVEECYRVACRLAEKAWQQGHRVHVVTDTEEGARAVDDLLWTFRQESFVPHERQTSAGAACDAPVVVAAREHAPAAADVLINVGADLPAAAGAARRVAEIVGPGETARAAGRERYRRYRDLGCELRSHRM